MAVSVTTNKNRLTSNGSTTAFNFTFPLPDSDTTQVKVILTVGSVDTVQDVSLYAVTATNNDFSSGGTVTFTTAPASGTITIYRDLATTQTSDYVPGGALDADTLEGNLDKLTMLVQEQQDAIDRSIKFPVTDATSLTSEIPNSSGRASNTLIFDSSGNVGAGDATTTSVTTGTEGWADTLNSYDQKEWIKLASSVSVTMNATATYSKVNIIYMTTSTNALTVALPAEASSDGRYLAIIKADSGTGTVMINNDDGDAVCAKLTKQYEIAHLICDGANWFLLNRPHNLGDGAIQNFGADGDVSLTHVADTGLLLNSTMQLQFNDASQNIQAPSATVLDINATDEIELNATLADVNANLDVSGTGVIGSATDSTSTTTGALTVTGGLGVAKNLHAGNLVLFGSVKLPEINHGESTTGGGNGDVSHDTWYNASRTHTTMTAGGSDSSTNNIGNAVFAGECYSGGTGNSPSASPSGSGQRFGINFHNTEYGETVITFATAGTFLVRMTMILDSVGGSDNDAFSEMGYYIAGETTASVVALDHNNVAAHTGDDTNRTFWRTDLDMSSYTPKSSHVDFTVVATAGQIVQLRGALLVATPYQVDVNYKTYVNLEIFG